MVAIENTICSDLERIGEVIISHVNKTNMTMKECLEDGSLVFMFGGAFAGDVMRYDVFAIMLLIALVTIIGNVLIIVCVVKSLHLNSSKYSIYVVSLGLSDLVIGAFCIPAMSLYTLLGYWPLGRVTCAFYILSDPIFLSISNLHLDVIAYDRFKAVADPLAYMSKFTRFRARILAALAWIVPMLYYIPLLKELQGPPIPEQCYYTLNTGDTIGIIMLITYGPSAGLIILSICLFYTMRRRGKSQLNLQPTAQHERNQDFENMAGKDKIRQQNRRCLITLLTQIILYLICWTPYIVVWPISMLCESCVPSGVYEISYYMVYLNSTGNPILYLIFNKDYRKAFLGMFTCSKEI